MQRAAFAALVAARDEFRSLVLRWGREHPYLKELQQRLAAELGYTDYEVQTPIVYNEALDSVDESDLIRVILVADNPGKKEQLALNRRYLVGQSGRLAEGWLGRELALDFRSEVLILNKTPIHTPKTAELRRLLALAGPRRNSLAALLEESQRAMADIAWKLYRAFDGKAHGSGAVLWISGCSELRRGGLFETYRNELARLAAEAGRPAGDRFWAFNHFSMNQFAIEMKRKGKPDRSAWENLARVGRDNADRIFSADGGRGT